MTTLGQSTKFTPDDRYELASLAEAQMRRNHPTHLLFLSGLVLLISVIVLVVAWRGDAKTHKDLSNKAFLFGSIQSEVNLYRSLASQSATTERNAAFDKISDMRSRQEAIAASVGLEASLGLPKTSVIEQGNAILNNYTYTVRDASLSHILAWIQAATEQVPGLEVSSIDITPTNQQWTVAVTLYRYERIE